MKKIYIAGCGGMLGEAFYKVLKDSYSIKCTDIDLNEKWLSYCDFRDYKLYKNDVISFSPDVLIHLGAFTDLEYCEQNVDQTYITNTLSVENAVYIANALNIPLIYISTAGIFDGGKLEYDDYDLPNPLCHYARSKYAGELFVKENVRKHIICRAGWMMGGGPKKDKKFVQKIIKQIKEGKKELFVVNDKMGTPTFTIDFAKNTKLLLENEVWGIYNMACEGTTSRLEVSKEIVALLKLQDDIKITEVNSDYFKAEYFATRPASERLINKKLSIRNLNQMRDWKICLKEYLKEYYEGYI